MVLWPGACMVHEIFSEKLLVQLKVNHPDSEIIAHPECEAPVLAHADYIGSTKQLLEYTQSSPKQSFIVVTEAGIIHQMQLKSPGKTFIPAPPDNGCACNECPHMRLNTMEKLYLALRDLQPQIHLDETVRLAAKKSLDRMLEMASGTVGKGDLGRA
jgi:quinolinate synthase